jgi:hypothetical protein
MPLTLKTMAKEKEEEEAERVCRDAVALSIPVRVLAWRATS